MVTTSKHVQKQQNMYTPSQDLH